MIVVLGFYGDGHDDDNEDDMELCCSVFALDEKCELMHSPVCVKL